jgi:hypothetical protein
LRFSGLILENIFMGFLGSSCRETAKNAIKNFLMGKDDRKEETHKTIPLLSAEKRTKTP